MGICNQGLYGMDSSETSHKCTKLTYAFDESSRDFLSSDKLNCITLDYNFYKGSRGPVGLFVNSDE